MDKTSQKVIWPPSTQLAPVPAVLVGCGSAEADWNLITIAWTGIVCSKPPMLSVSVRPERHSHELIRRSGEFTVNIPTAAMADDVDWCGVVSGRDHRKFAERNLSPIAGSQVSAPLVAECPLGLECRVKEVLQLGSHDLFLAEILAVQVTESWINESGRLELERAGLLSYVHGHYFGLGECIGHFGYSVRKKPGSVIRK